MRRSAGSLHHIRLWQAGLLLLAFVLWHVMTRPDLLPPLFFDNDRQGAFFFGEPPKVLARIWAWFVRKADIYRQLAVTLTETLLAFGIGSTLGLAFVGAVVGEYLGSSQGVGYLILQAEGTFDINTVMAGVLVPTGLALLLDALVGRIERHLMKWQPHKGQTEKL